eukprot:NODE_2647_length_457_cov_444.600490_g2191_i0.p1 GENE.NODE_2647_length_457_cov_444.600490_g2191_i0~~NODE_2647_length_457_cov_444.600490_g2191_i0.p1  ORF type:complete len:108 (+),score=7.33 NODE_2647_length_457_cov_444.600490_g2191_i0:33-356(+)
MGDIYTGIGALPESLVVTDNLLTHFYGDANKYTEDGRFIASDLREGDKDIIRLPMHPTIRRSIFQLIAVEGLAAVRDAVANLQKPAHPCLRKLLEEAMALRVVKYDR